LLVYIVRIAEPPARFRERLRTVEGATFVRELPPDRVVVTLSSDEAEPRLAALDGVESLTRDRRERPAR
jgi:hypothetical protein